MNFSLKNLIFLQEGVALSTTLVRKPIVKIAQEKIFVKTIFKKVSKKCEVTQ